LIVSIVIPVFKSQESLEDLSLMLLKQERIFADLGVLFEVIFVIDGSPDESLNILLGKKNEKLLPASTRIIELSRNFGQVSALVAGLEISQGDCSICYSADMQDPPELFLKMYQMFIENNEIVLAVRGSRRDSFFRNFTSKIGYSILRSKVPTIPKGGFDYFLIGDTAKKSLLTRSGSKRFIQGDILNLGFNPRLIEYSRVARDKGKSAYTFRKRLEAFADAFYDSSDLPIKVATRLGFGIATSGILSAGYLLLAYFNGESPFNGFTAIATSVLILGGIQLMVLGVIGEYIYRIYDISRNRPKHVIKNIF
jgi:glycosyltransferase involved in cell wall biosynthesis